MKDIAFYKQQMLPVLHRFDVQHAAIFGSVAKGLSGEGSDIDVLITPGENFTIFKMIQLEEEIAEILNCKVDLVEFNALKPSIKQEVLATAITIL